MSGGYNKLSTYLRNRFGERTLKICVDAGFTCPNRDGTKAYGGCIFCSEKGSGELIKSCPDIASQVTSFLDSYRGKRANKFIVYFQNFTNTYASITTLKQRYDSALVDDRIIGISIATRPDCIDEDVCKLIASYKDKYYVSVELGLQTVNDIVGNIINRCYTTQDFVNAVNMLKKYDIEVNPVEVGTSFLPYGKDYGFEVSNLEITKSNIEGLNVGDTITKVNGEEIKDLETLLVTLEDIEDEFKLTILDSKEKTKDFTIQVKVKENDTSLGFSYGFYLKGEEQTGLLAGIKYAFLKFFSTIEQMIFTVFYLITGKISLGMMSGPVGIFNVVGTVSKAGFTSVISLLCLICINVGFINILPFPAFDGGHVVFILIEKIKGSRVDPKVENTIHSIGFILLMILMVLITYNDIIKLF